VSPWVVERNTGAALNPLAVASALVPYR
jgi:hypothetical protein